MSIQRRSFSATRWTSISSFARAGFQFAQVAILARILSPQDYGLMALVTVVLSYTSMFSDMGLSAAFVQRQQITQEERSGLYWLSVIVGVVLMLLVMAASPLLALLFDKPQLVPLLVLTGTNFLVISLGQQLRVESEKNLNFQWPALIEVISSGIGFVVAVVTAYMGFGVYALVVASMVTAWVALVLSWLLMSNGWRPALHFRWVEVSWFVRFGSAMVTNNMLNHITSTIDLLLCGRLLPVSQLGMYSVPRNLVLQIQFLINPIFTRVGFPLIASIQNDKERVRQVYLKTMNNTASINAPIYIFMAVFSPEIVALLLGDKWQDSASLLRVLAIWGLFRSFGNPLGSLLFGMGRVRLSSYWNLAQLLIFSVAIWWGAMFGAAGIARVLAVLFIVMFFPAWAMLVRPVCGAKFWEYSKQVIMPSLCAVFAGLVAWLMVIIIDMAWLRFGLGVVYGFISYVLASWTFNREFLETIIRSLRDEK